jgi:zinc and cadmium transporter
MTASGSSRFSRHLLNALFSLVSPAGAILFYLGASRFADSNGVLLGCALAFCTGTFLCIASSDLLPELQFHSHDRFKLSVALLAGLSVAVLIKHFEADNEPVPTSVAALPANSATAQFSTLVFTEVISRPLASNPALKHPAFGC